MKVFLLRPREKGLGKSWFENFSKNSWRNMLKLSQITFPGYDFVEKESKQMCIS